MRSYKLLAVTAIALTILLVAVPSTTRVYGNTAAPCAQKCSIGILGPGSGGALNKNQTVNPTFLVSFVVNNFTLVQPGTINDVNTTTSGGPNNPLHNEGHIHVFVDNAYVTLWTSTNGIPLTLSPGTHTVRLNLVNDFHADFSPAISASTTVNVIDPNAPLQSTANSAQSNASNAMNYSLGALIVSIISLILVAYVAFKPKPKP